jgi:hypothetical protein
VFLEARKERKAKTIFLKRVKFLAGKGILPFFRLSVGPIWSPSSGYRQLFFYEWHAYNIMLTTHSLCCGG